MRAWLAVLFVAMAGCGASHERDGEADAGSRPVDAGPGGVTDAGHDIESCEGVFDASPGASCPEWLECQIGDFGCVRRYAMCAGGRLSFDETDRSHWVGPRICEDLGAVMMSATSAAGTRVLTASTASFSHGFAIDVHLIFFDGSDVMECGLPRLSVYLTPHDVVSETPYVGEHEAVGTLAVGDDVVTVTGAVVITAQTTAPDGRVILDGSLELSGEGTSVGGVFSVRECRDLDRSGL